MNTPTLYVAKRDGRVRFEAGTEQTDQPPSALQLVLFGDDGKAVVAPMDLEEWSEFVDAARDLLARCGGAR